jgi:formate hydrogenlyase subunit 6/NADH:ubiquinone oxidoreductase subunit I
VGCKKCVNNCPTLAIKEISEFENAPFHRRLPRRRHPKWERMLVDLLK